MARAIWNRRGVRALLVLAVILAIEPAARRRLRAKSPRPDDATFQEAERVEIVRDKWGVPHVFGKSDADAAFGLAYANAEDDFPTVQGVLAAATGRLGLVLLSKKALANDYYVALARVREDVAAGYDALSPDYRAVLEGYARGMNLYAYLHPDEADGRLFPLSGRDIAAGFAHKVPLMFDLPDVLSALLDDRPKKVGDPVFASRETGDAAAPARFMPGSNAHALSARRSTDGVTRLNVNSHQPWEGPVTWYEAEVVSEEGWNMTGALFPGAPTILHGHNDRLGWAHTVNDPDLIDVYELSMVPGKPDTYVIDGVEKKLERKEASLSLDVGFFTVTVGKDALWSEIGPVLATDHGVFAIRWAGMGHAIRAGEQWYRMNKAKTFAEWKDAMRMQAIPMFNTAYADADHVYYVYNALLPVRRGPYDYTKILPGDRSDAIWTDYVPFDELPQVEDPPSGFVQTCNSSPFATTTGEGNPKPEAFAANAGIETKVTNRAARSLALLGVDAPLSRDDFMRMKWDRTYAEGSALRATILAPLLAMPSSTWRSPAEAEAIALLRGWNGVADESSPAATVAILTWRRASPGDAGARGDPPMPLVAAFRDAVGWLLARYGRASVPLGTIQRLRHGAVDLPLGGGPDVINAVVDHETPDGHLVGYQGDSYVLEVEFPKDGSPPASRSIHQYGASVRAGSPHYADQAPMFVKHELKPTLRRPADLAAAAERRYHPGQER